MKSAVVDLGKSGFSVVLVDCRRNPEVATKHGIEVVPTFVFAEYGKVKEKIEGQLSAKQMKGLFK